MIEKVIALVYPSHFFHQKSVWKNVDDTDHERRKKSQCWKFTTYKNGNAKLHDIIFQSQITPVEREGISKKMNTVHYLSVSIPTKT